jgi:hypothetical protein
VKFTHPGAKTRRNRVENSENYEAQKGRKTKNSHAYFIAIKRLEKFSALIVFPACIPG